MTPPTSRRRLSVAAPTCYKPGERLRLIYCPARDRRADGRKSFDYRDLLTTVHTQLGGSLIVGWDNLNTHPAKGMREFTDAHDWLSVYRLPPYCPDLNPVEGIWSLLRRKLANTAFTDPDHLVRAARRDLREIQRRPQLINGVFADTGLAYNTNEP